MTHSSLPSILFAVLFYCGISMSVVFLNRHLFTQTFKYPIFVSWVQQIVGAIVYYIVAVVGTLVPSLTFFPLVQPSLQTVKHMLPLSLSFVGMIGFSNLCLQFVQVSTYQVARSLTLLFNLILSYIILSDRISYKAVLACVMVVSGFVVGSLDPSTMNVAGIVTGVLASLSQAIYNVLIKRTLQFVNDDMNVLLCYNLTLSSVMFIPVIFLSGEGGFTKDLPLLPSDSSFFDVWIGLIGSGVLGISLTFASYLCVKVTSPVTFNVVGYGKACLQSLGGIVFLSETYTPKSLSGILLTLFGSAWYSQVKMSERSKMLATVSKVNDDIKLEIFGRSDTEEEKEVLASERHRHSVDYGKPTVATA